MKIKSILFALIFIFGALISDAQIVAKGDKLLNFGVGLGSNLYSGAYYRSVLPPVSASLEIVILDGLLDNNAAVGIGGYFGVSSFRSEFNFGSETYGRKYLNFVIGPRGYFHYNFVDNLDTYAGMLLGYRLSPNREYGTIHSGYFVESFGGIAWSGFIGGRYYLSDQLALMAELGYGISYLNFGIAIKL